MLKNLHVHATIPVKDIERAKKFYSEKLGLTPKSEAPGGLIYECADGSWFLLFPTPLAGSAQNTAAGWTASDIGAEVKELKARGVVFEDYDNPKTVDSIAQAGPNKAAWFKDSEGNTLGIVQFG